MSTDTEDARLLALFLKSEIWTGPKEKTPLKEFSWRDQITKEERWWELQVPVRTFVYQFYRVPHGVRASLEIENTVQRVTRLFRSQNARQAAYTKARRTLKKRKARLKVVSKQLEKAGKRIARALEREKRRGPRLL